METTTSNRTATLSAALLQSLQALREWTLPPAAQGERDAGLASAEIVRGLVRDISSTITDEKISIRGMNTVTSKADNLAHMQFTLSVSGLPQLSRVLARIAQLPNIISARRKR